jgi:O-antigen ligase
MNASLIVALCIVVLVLALRQRPLAIALVAALVPAYTLRASFFGVPTTALECAIATLYAVFLYKTLFAGEWREHLHLVREHRSVRFMLATGVIFIVIGIMSSFVTPDTHAALGLLRADIIAPVLFGFMAMMTLRTQKDIRLVLWALLLSGAVVAVIAIVQYATNIGIPEPWNIWPGRRATSVYGFPNAVGLYLAPLSTLAIGMLLFAKDLSRKTRFAVVGSLTLMLAGIVFSHSDGAVAAVAAATFCMLLCTRFRIPALVVSVALAVAAFAFPPTREILLFQDVSGQVRLALWHGMVSLLKAQPIFGAGLGGFPAVYDLFRLPSHVELLLYPHNELLNFWVELGIAGATWIVVMVAWCLARIAKLRRVAPAIALPLLGIIVAYIVYGLVDVPYFKNDLAVLFWLWIAILATTSYKKEIRSVKP